MGCLWTKSRGAWSLKELHLLEHTIGRQPNDPSNGRQGNRPLWFIWWAKCWKIVCWLFLHNLSKFCIHVTMVVITGFNNGNEDLGPYCFVSVFKTMPAEFWPNRCIFMQKLSKISFPGPWPPKYHLIYFWTNLLLSLWKYDKDWVKSLTEYKSNFNVQFGGNVNHICNICSGCIIS